MNCRALLGRPNRVSVLSHFGLALVGPVDVDTSVLTFSFLLSVRFSSMQCAMPVKEGDGRCAKASSPILKVEDVRWCGYFDFLPPYLVHGRFVQAPFRWCPITHDSSKVVSLPLKSAATS